MHDWIAINSWGSLQEGDTVYMLNEEYGTPALDGPFAVVDIEEKVLMKNGCRFQYETIACFKKRVTKETYTLVLTPAMVGCLLVQGFPSIRKFFGKKVNLTLENMGD